MIDILNTLNIPLHGLEEMGCAASGRYDSSLWTTEPSLPAQWASKQPCSSIKAAELDLLKQRLTALLDVELSNADATDAQPALPVLPARELVAS